MSDALLADSSVAAFAALGDLQYDNGTLKTFMSAYAPTYGRLLDRTIPVAGNHEYQTGGAAGYYDYFGARAGDRTKGYYCDRRGGLARRGAQLQLHVHRWLRCRFPPGAPGCARTLRPAPLAAPSR